MRIVIVAALSVGCAPEVVRFGVDVVAIALDSHAKTDANSSAVKRSPCLPIAPACS